MIKVLDVGCGDIKENWKGDGIDIFPYGQKYTFDIEELSGWTEIESNMYDKIICSHILEHIKKPESFINILNQVWRVGKPNALFIGEAPRYDSMNFFRDPFHCRPISENTFDAFFVDSKIHFGSGYNVKCKFRPINRGVYVNGNRDVVWELQIVK